MLSRAVWTGLISTLTGTAAAGGLELAVYVGASVPFYGQSFRYDPSPLLRRFPSGVTIREDNVFRFDARGDVALGGGVTWFFAGPLGLEGRLDSVDASVTSSGALYSLFVDLPRPLGSLSQEFDLGSGVVELERLRPLSLNLKLQTGGRARLYASAGVSYLPALRFAATQAIGSHFTVGGVELPIRSSVPLRAEALPEEERGRFGFDVGAGVKIRLIPKLALLAEARYFRFPEHVLQWSVGTELPLRLDGSGGDLAARIPPVRFDPTFFQATAGIAVTF